MVKNPSANASNLRASGSVLGREDALEEGMATHSGILAGEEPRTGEPAELQSIESQRVGHDQATTPTRDRFR